MSELRDVKDEATTQNRGIVESLGSDCNRDVKLKQQNLFAKKYDGFSDTFVSANMNDVNYGSFPDEGSTSGTSFIPSLSVVNNSQVHELRFFNLEGVSQAEKDILQDIIHNSQWYSDTLFCFMRRSPSPGDPSVESIDRCLTETGIDVEGDGIPEVSGDPDNVLGHIPDDNPHIQNGPVVEIPQSHMTPIDDGLSNVITQGVPPTSIRPFYPSQPHLAVSTTGPGQTIPPTSVQIPVSGTQMVMYPQQMQQLMQTGHAGYPMPVGYPPLHYGYPQHGGQPHVTYVSPSGEPISPESVHMGPPPSHKGHHDGHHGMPHTSTSGPGGSGGYAKPRNHRRENVKQQQQQPYYYQSYGYATQMPYHSHQQLAQNVTGSPIIMQAPGNIYPYHQQPHPSMYSQNTAVGSDMEHHQSNIGMPQSLAHIGGEMTQYAQHHHVPHMYHHSPTHSGNRGGSYPQQSIRGGNVIPPPVEQPPNVTADSQSDLDSEKIVEADVSQSTPISVVNHSQRDGFVAATPDLDNSQKKSLLSDASVETPETVRQLVPGVNEIEVLPIIDRNVESLTEPNRDNEVVVSVITATSPSLTPADNKRSNNVKSGAIGGDVVSVVDIQAKAFSSEDQEKAHETSAHAINGEIKNIKPSTGKGIPRDKSSAEPVPLTKKEVEIRQPGNTIAKLIETKSKPVNANNSRSVNVVSNPSVVSTSQKDVSSDTKLESESGGGEFPQLSPNNVSSNSNTVSSGSANFSNSSRNAGAPAKGRSWASIASAKSQMTASDGANLNNKRAPSIHGLDQGGGDGYSVSGSSRLCGEQCSTSCVPSSHSERGLAKSDVEFVTNSSAITDENDPVALALGEFLRNYTLDHHSIALTPRGLCNQGNYCYINATLQSLLACPPLVNLFRAMGEILNRKPCRATPIIQNVFELVSEFEPLLRGNANKKDRMKDVFNVGANLEPIGIRKCLGHLDGSTFKVEGRQEDAEEFLSHLLNGLHDEMLKVMKWAEQSKERSSGKLNVTPNTTQGLGATNGGDEGVSVSGDEDDDQWQVMGAKNKSCLTRKTTVSKTPVSEAFLGQMCYLYRVSSTGSNKSATLQPFYTLQLDIQNDGIRSVRDALEAISAKEEVSGMLSSNGVEMEAWRQLSLEELPVVLILHLKRFVYEKNGNKIRKIDKKLDFGIDLEIGKDLLSVNAKSKYNIRQRQYKLFGVVYHDGEEAHKGHYIADCFHASGGSMWGQCGWLRFDDTAVKQIPESMMLNPQPPRVPYLLYYRRADTLLSHVTQQQHKKDRP
ncbi:unnamed protein product [Orchesella dallaii]|uniref:ubiquitinyl hydrolase 1 n=1 Tax=Orchesella dallaii TaxID=48710 RepID=A0ABP1QD96_9HEXA